MTDLHASRYRQLDAAHILATLETLRQRITGRFPGSGLSKVAAELQTIGQETRALASWLRRPVWTIRLIGGAAIVFMIAVVLLVIAAMRLPAGVDGMAEFLQAGESLINDRLAALHIQHFNDSVVLGAVTEIETLTNGLSGKIWQKITLLERAGP